MCGIVGFTKNEKYELLLPEMLEMQAHRGEDSYGAVFIFNNKIKTIKSLDLDKFLKKFDKVAKNNYKFVVIHHRQASIGGINLELAHPVVKGDTSIIHNGTKKNLYESYKSLVNSDTEAITILAQHLGFEHQIFKASLIDAGVIFGFNTKENKLFFHHDGSRSLFVYEDNELIASEPVLPGKWRLIKGLHQFNYKNWNSLIRNLKTKKEIKVDEYVYPQYCYECGVIHLHNIDGVCLTCNKGEDMNYLNYNVKSYRENELVFVYGTLKKGYGNHGVMKEAGGIKICDAVTKEKYVMGGNGIPYVMKEAKGEKHPISGEVYKIKNLAPLDELEGHPNFYKREKIEIVCENGVKKSAWLYFYTGNEIENREDWIEDGKYVFPNSYDYYYFEDEIYENEKCCYCGTADNLIYLEDDDVYICSECLDYFMKE